MEFDIYTLVENDEIECKEALGGLPKDLWETYSAFANSNGGTLFLGIKEKSAKFFFTGVKDEENIIKDLWDNLNNPKKVSANILGNNSIEILTIEGAKVIKINVPKADRKARPVYIGENPFNESKHSGTFRRNYSGDYKCSKEEIKRMIADQLDESQDSLILQDFDIDDLNQDTIDGFRNRLRALKPYHPWIALDDKTFLYKLGAYDKDRKLGKEGITAAGLLMFGEERSITDEFPNYFLDYREKISEEVRWDYRLISSDGTWSGNIFDFYFKIINKITDNLNVPFRTINGIRQEDTRVHEAVREAVANALIHADYRLPRGIVIEKGKTYFKVSNPGNLRITREEALKGGISDPRNQNIFKMFNLLGIGERAGSGLENIQLAWKEQQWIAPDLEESYGPDRIILTLRTVSMLPKESVDLLKAILKEQYIKLSKDEVMALVTAAQEEYVTNNRLQQLLDTHAINSNKILSTLVDKGYLKADGIGRGTKYYLSEIFNNNYLLWNENDKNQNNDKRFSNEEKLIINYINNNKFITNLIARNELGFSKTTASRLFNRLIKKGVIVRIGSGSKIKYIINES
ncbi:RNA-binding domain-containing protein [Clostridium sporogenes]|uniref:RNA-binding domain-containing protein n=1 Tax=Clostridium TaxID=1485 RepID=UPI0005EDCACD|nr:MULTISPECIES: RNA-binding domain-containing protein [Clostridium]KOY67525.1 transcriptional regulator [Clostridium sporogenes]KYN77767.1 transcriptional regulator [Clostridium sporogenes]MBW5457271.1 transcriptional regulator [Clostridium sporogenes]MCW6061998.1 putative DNA binding domain-containing protein [Clostridium sporogenes]MCW6068005.1 putative DNA binding domain-containing protein [Clostridium sporogenes]